MHHMQGRSKCPAGHFSSGQPTQGPGLRWFALGGAALAVPSVRAAYATLKMRVPGVVVLTTPGNENPICSDGADYS